MIEWSNDDENLVAPPPSVQTPSRITHVEEQPREDEEVPEQQTEINPERRAEETPEQQAEQRPTFEERRPAPLSTGVDHPAVPGGSGRHRRFKKVHRQTKLWVSLCWSYFAISS